ncbi:MAG: restriction endonuclease subunit S [Polaromonas sp.]|nr:restriction endonuclease subunit S [Polaromonas sp.]
MDRFTAGQSRIQKCTIGSSQSAFTIVLLKGIEIALPPMPVQQRIATILSAYDDLIENSQRRIKILEAMARGLYREWFVHFRFPGHENHPRVASALGEIPQGWEVKRVTDAIYVNPRIVVSREGKKPFVPMSCLSNDSMLITDVEYAREIAVQNFRTETHSSHASPLAWKMAKLGMCNFYLIRLRLHLVQRNTSCYGHTH